MIAEERENPLIDQEITVSETWHKTATVTTRNYILKSISQGEDGRDDIEADFTDTNLLEEFKLEHYTISELLEQTQIMLKKVLPLLLAGDRTKALGLIQACKGWVQDEIEAVI